MTDELEKTPEELKVERYAKAAAKRKATLEAKKAAEVEVDSVEIVEEKPIPKIKVMETPEVERGTKDRAREIEELNIAQKEVAIGERKVFWQVKKNYHAQTGTVFYEYGWFYVHELFKQLDEAVDLRRARYTFNQAENTIKIIGLGGQYEATVNVTQPIELTMRTVYKTPMLLVEDGGSQPLGSMV